MPRVLNIKRDILNWRGWNFKRDGLVPGAIYIGRVNRSCGLPESKWHNPFKLRKNATSEERADRPLIERLAETNLLPSPEEPKVVSLK
jgi:hypothetical protein